MDSCHYERNTNGSPFTGGYFTSDRLAWITNQLAEARDQGKFVIGMMHHGIMEHFIGQKTLFPEYVVDDYATIDNLFSSYGMKVVFTGHFHAQDATKTTLKTGTLFDIETGSCVTFPCPYRLISLETNSVLTVHSFPTTSIDYDLGGLDFPTFAYEFLTNGLHGLVTNMLMSAPYSLPQANASFLAPALVEGMAFHYQGDETSRTISAQSQAIMGYLKSQTDAMSQMMYGVLLCLYNDPALPDNNLRVNLINGLSLTLP
jgi:hypothetical protein